jgi:serine/threonine-protein kinase HipA
MAANLWGKVFYQDRFAGYLSQEPGNRYVFQYDASYLNSDDAPAIAYTLPLQTAPFINEAELHPFFDNLVAEGWLRDAQARAIGARKSDRFNLLLAFGADCIGAISIIDPKPTYKIQIDLNNAWEFAALASHISLSGIQPKLGVVKTKEGFRPAKAGELSTHIAKLPPGNIPHIMQNEYLTTLAYQALLKGDEVVQIELAPIQDVIEKSLIIKRFDRTDSLQKLPFEEFNQLLGQPSEDKYRGNYEDMGKFMLATPACLKAEVDKLYRRILACILVGNTDAHLKNFSMFHRPEGLRLTPAYDIVASALYPEYQTLALGFNHAHNLQIGKLKPNALIQLGQTLNLPFGAIQLAVDDLHKQLIKAEEKIMGIAEISDELKHNLITMMNKRWNGTFALIGPLLSKKP